MKYELPMANKDKITWQFNRHYKKNEQLMKKNNNEILYFF